MNRNRTLMTITSGATTEAVVKYFYDSLGRLARQEDSRTGNYAFNYDALSRRTNLTYPNGVKAYYQYDNASRLIALLNLAADGTPRGYGIGAAYRHVEHDDPQIDLIIAGCQNQTGLQ